MSTVICNIFIPIVVQQDKYDNNSKLFYALCFMLTYGTFIFTTDKKPKKILSDYFYGTF